jgi:signal transduction histidine kinase
MRNPLNGVYQNADLVSESIQNVKKEVLTFCSSVSDSHQTTETLPRLLGFLKDELVTDLEALESLKLCAKHQKRIADDVLQMSKLSMNLVSLSETPFDPLVEMTNSIRMFEREAATKGIRLSFSLKNQYRSLSIGWVRADPIRFSQILVNFISNALRFTENAPIRVIEVTLDASEEPPNLSQPLTTTNEVKSSRLSEDNNDESPPVFLIVSVVDTGVGLTPGERVNLFQKFSQASPKTYSQYGGSGLGLYISKALVEVQGGRISLESEKDKGTTVTFYIRCKRAARPDTTPVSRNPSKGQASTVESAMEPEPVTPKPRSSPLNILVVEDNLVITFEDLANLD